MTDGPLNASEPALLGGDGGLVTLVDGSTFCLSTRTGDIVPGDVQGLYFRDARVLSRLELRLDGVVPQPLSVLPEETYGARFVLRRPPSGGRADSTLLLVRERLVADGLREVVTLRNLGAEATTATLSVWLGADFADLFTVKAGRADAGEVIPAVEGGILVLTGRDGERGLRVSATGDAVVTPAALTWRVVVPPRGSWSTEISVQPVMQGRVVPPRVDRGQGMETSRPAHQLREWRRASTTVTAGHPVLAEVLRRTEADLGVLQIRDQLGDRPVVAAGAPWFMTLFGRDSLLTAYMALPLETSLAIGTLETLARLQGRRVDPLNEEEPGRILHELRLGPDRDSALGGSHYYGTVDAGPLFVSLLAEAWRWGAPEEAVRELLPAADAALEWMEQYGDRDGDGFLEYQRATDRGLVNQGWKDSFDGINDAEGRLGEPPIALAEVQGYAYAARLARAELAEAFGDPLTAQRMRRRAAQLQQAFAERFWLPDRGWYAVALDRDKRPLDALTSNAAQCLWSGIVPDEHAAVLVRRLAGDTMDSGFGLRTLATDMGAYNPMSYHNGSVWPHDTALAVAGLVRYAHVPGAVELAQHLAEGLLDAAAAFGGRLPELFCGFSRSEFDPPVPYPTSCSPQAWASAAPLLLVRALLGLEPDVPRRRLALRPRLPGSWGRLVVEGLDLGDARQVRIEASGDTVEVHGLPEGWTLVGAGEPVATGARTA
ncbi:glycogen debranching N-terminal domain-containing protein [Blastococcus sp. SYSU DS0552]